MDTTDVTSAARKTGDHPIVEKGARVGYAMSGIIHFIIGWIALKLAWGIGGGSSDADTSGALRTVASSGAGPIMLGFAVVGFLMLAVALGAAAVVGTQGGEASDRIKSAAKAVMYASFAWSSFAIARGASSSDEAKTDDVTAQVMGMPGGRFLIALVGLVVLGVAGYHVYKGWSKKFLGDLEEHPGDWAVTAGRVGYIAKGCALVVVGLLFLLAAWHGDSEEAAGLDGALTTIKDLAFGPYLLTLVAAGIASYGVYSFARARYARL
jgi:hypothetical protein